MARLSWDEYFMDITLEVAKSGTCDRGRTGVIVVKDNKIVGTGYVGSPPNTPHCDDEGHLIRQMKHEDGKKSMHCLRTTHGEQSTVAIAASKILQGSTLYSLISPTYTEAKLIATSGIERVVCENMYHHKDIDEMFRQAGIKYEDFVPDEKQDLRLRPSVDQYIMNITRKVAQRSTCDVSKNGVVIAKRRVILSTGYVGAPSRMPHCDEAGHQIKEIYYTIDYTERFCSRTISAAENAIALAARPVFEGGTLYCKLEPCYSCSKMLIPAGIKRVVCEKKYHTGEDTRKLFKEYGITFITLKDEIEQYDDQ